MGNSVSAHIYELVSLGTTKFGVLGGKATVLVYMHGQSPI